MKVANRVVVPPVGPPSATAKPLTMTMANAAKDATSNTYTQEAT
jgi:hypothetical protein